MSAPISRKRAAMAVGVFALILIAWTSIGAQRSLACTIPDPPGCFVVDETTGVAVGTATGAADDAQANVLGNVAGSLSGNGPANTPGIAGVPTSHAASGYELATGQSFVGSQPCTIADSTGRASIPTVGRPCSDNNKYACWALYIETKRKYTSAIYWDWITKMNWCGWSLGKITSRTYDDHWGLAMGYQCGLTKEVRTPVEKIDDGHWQQHSNFTFKCHAGGLDREDHATEGAHYYNNGYWRRIQSGGD